MKHYVFHLISVIILIVLFLITLDLVRDKQNTAKQLDSLTEKNTSTEQLLEKERAEKEQLLADNAQKAAEFEAENRDLQEKLSILEESVAEMGRRFQIVSARDSKMLGLVFEQTPRSDADAAAAVALADSLKKPVTPAGFKDEAEKTLEPLFSASRELVLDPENGYVIDPVAAIVETAAKAANLSAATAVYWDTSRKAFRSEVTVSDPGKKEKAVVSIGGSKTFRDATFQLSPNTTIFPFTDISLLSRNGVDLLNRAASIPVGGLYVHYFRVYSKGPWVLEYVFPEKVEPESVNMNLLLLSPGTAVTSTITGRTFTFHVSVENKEAAFLVIADKPFFPDSAAIRLK
jgi:hypothetical protein